MNDFPHIEEIQAGLAAVTELYRGLWQLAFSREQRTEEQDREFLASTNARRV
jgi:hypothetical protein